MAILETLTANGTTAVDRFSGFARGTVWVSGNFGGGTFVLEVSRDEGVTWILADTSIASATTFTANDRGNFQVSANYSLRGRLYVATNPNIFVAVDVW